MDHMTHQDREAVEPHAGHKISGAHTSHDRHAGHSVAMFRDKFWLSFALTIPVVFWSTDVQHWLGYSAPSAIAIQHCLDWATGKWSKPSP